ncbi:glycosyltransferase family 2 protein [Gilvimarinus sp. 1_MG-2023]|uniref:glycosyltransferase family 2 protein n=1 Tax=Gilvimarinus sp. 1_MG-2023 TaxID=3062638 RepID=UPI0026E2D4B9|nr:glycosyltransferase family 2 protein [Gilvimarinus sp. 1_MG-2023]MDO6746271.1 glycosyltransferase family 2 protein [Gilvimarinus sp. 1_MG-2023]
MKNLKLCMTILVRDEAALIRENLDYHLSRGVDFIIATDNCSQDGTATILREYEKKGLLHYIFEPADDYSQDLWVTRMARIAAEEYKADWIMHTDADEFWWPSNSEKIPDILGSVAPNIDGLKVRRSNFAPTDGYDNELPFYSQLTVREKHSLNSLGRPLPPKICHRGRPDVKINQGNHSFELHSQTPCVKQCNEILIFHFPQRGFNEFQKRVRQGGAAYNRNNRLAKNVGNTWRKLYQLEQRGELKNYFDGATFSEEQITQGISENTLIVDTRLSDYMQKMRQTKP